MKIGIMILTIKGIDSSGQIDITHKTCYKIAGGVHYRKSFDLVVDDRMNIETFDNAFILKTGFRNREKILGISSSYQIGSNSFGIGPYYRYLTITDREYFVHYVELNYQFMFNKARKNELNISTGLFLFEGKLPFSINLACQYTYTYGSGDNHLFRPVVGVHYSFRAKIKKRQTSE
jgi:hypothetical protein